MKPTYATPADEYIALHDLAADNWVLTHRAEFDVMAKEAFGDSWRPGAKGTTQQRIEFLNRQCAIKAGVPSYDEWLRRNGLTLSQERASA